VGVIIFFLPPDPEAFFFSDVDHEDARAAPRHFLRTPLDISPSEPTGPLEHFFACAPPHGGSPSSFFSLFNDSTRSTESQVTLSCMRVQTSPWGDSHCCSHLGESNPFFPQRPIANRRFLSLRVVERGDSGRLVFFLSGPGFAVMLVPFSFFFRGWAHIRQCSLPSSGRIRRRAGLPFLF